MDTSELQDDVDKLSQILDEPDPADFNEKHGSTLNSQCETSEKSDMHSLLAPTLPLSYGHQSSTFTPDIHQVKHGVGHPDNSGILPLQPDAQESSVCDSLLSSRTDKDESKMFIFKMSGNDQMKFQKNNDQLSLISPPTGTDLAEPPGNLALQGIPNSHGLESSTQIQPSPIGPSTSPLAQPMPESPRLETSSQAQQIMMSPSPPPGDMLHSVGGLLPESCAPDFDPPDAVIEMDAGAVDNKMPVSGGIVTANVLNATAGGSGGSAGDIVQLAQVLDVPGGGGRATEGPPIEWEEDTAPAPPVDPDGPSTLQGDINKLSRVLAADAIAESTPLNTVRLPTMVPSPRHTLSTDRSGNSSHAEFSLPSVPSTSGAQLQSALGDEFLSQGDFLDDTFIGQDIPVNLENCLALNAAYQEVVDENVADLEHLLEMNRKRQTELAVLLNNKQDSGRPTRFLRGRLTRWNWHQFLYEHFSDADGFGPKSNTDTLSKLARGEYEELRWSRPWLQSERERLFEAVLGEARRRYVRLAHHNVTSVRGVFRQLDASVGLEKKEAALTTLKDQLDEAENLLAEAKEASVLDILTELNDDYDWQKISQTILDNGRTSTECRLQWCNFLRPTISHADWSHAEDLRVRSAATAKTSRHRWQAAAEELNRSSFQVYQRWAAVLSVSRRNFWTEAESKRLTKVVDEVRVGNHVKWLDVALRLPGRSAMQCRQRYVNLSLGRRCGRFHPEEDMRLIVAIEELGMQDYRAISAYIPNRTVAQLQNRYRRYLAPNLYRGDWTREEDERLVRSVRDHGPQWAHAAAVVGNGRNGTHCRMRFRRIEYAFQSHGGVPASGSLGGKALRYYSDYYTKIRDTINQKLSRQKPHDGEDPVKVRKQAALAFLAKLPKLRKRERTRTRGPRVQGTPKWKSSIGDFMIAEGRQPHRRMHTSDNREAEAAIVTARIWCLSSPTPARLESCAATVNEYDAMAFSRWRAALLPDAPESSLRQAAEAVGQREYNWRRMPLLPASFASCTAFRSLMLLRPRLEQCAIEGANPPLIHSRRREALARRVEDFNRINEDWATATMAGGNGGNDEGERDTQWPEPANRTQHHDHMVRVRVTEKPQGNAPPRQLYMTVAAAEADDPDQLARRIHRQVPDMRRLEIFPRRLGSDNARGRPATSSFRGAWHLLLARFVSMFFWPALLSSQPLPDMTYRGETDVEVDLSLNNLYISVLGNDSKGDEEAAGGPRKRFLHTKQPGPNPKRKKTEK